MGRRAIRKKSFWKKHWFSMLLSLIVLGLIVGLTALILPLLNPCRTVLKEGGVPVEKVQKKGDLLTMTFEGDVEGILACRKALNLLRAEGKIPERVQWILTEEETELLRGTLEQADYIPAAESPRLETLSADLTLLKLKVELEENGLSVQVRAEETVGLSGKTVTVTAETTKDALSAAATAIPAVLQAINEEGGGIVRCDVIFQEYGQTFAAASYDLTYGDTLFSAAFSEE